MTGDSFAEAFFLGEVFAAFAALFLSFMGAVSASADVFILFVVFAAIFPETPFPGFSVAAFWSVITLTVFPGAALVFETAVLTGDFFTCFFSGGLLSSVLLPDVFDLVFEAFSSFPFSLPAEVLVNFLVSEADFVAAGFAAFLTSFFFSALTGVFFLSGFCAVFFAGKCAVLSEEPAFVSDFFLSIYNLCRNCNKNLKKLFIFSVCFSPVLSISDIDLQGHGKPGSFFHLLFYDMQNSLQF
ncbi:MAG: hypothetical protein OEW04_09295 [Nitrospirota bacterium]|nr:hypothetical protein [Nitrospirota bacterium]